MTINGGTPIRHHLFLDWILNLPWNKPSSYGGSSILGNLHMVRLDLTPLSDQRTRAEYCTTHRTRTILLRSAQMTGRKESVESRVEWKWINSEKWMPIYTLNISKYTVYICIHFPENFAWHHFHSRKSIVYRLQFHRVKSLWPSSGSSLWPRQLSFAASINLLKVFTATSYLRLS